MSSQQRLTLASIWAFEDVGVQEIQDQINAAYPARNISCEYTKPHEAFVFQASDNIQAATVAQTISSYIDGQKYKDLLDVPRISQIEIPAAISEGNQDPVLPPDETHDQLLMLDDGFIDDLNPIHVTKRWSSDSGGAGCFVSFPNILNSIESCTGTTISIVDECKGISVRGNNTSDVYDALSKLTRIEISLSCIDKPQVANIGLLSSRGISHLQIQHNSAISGRILPSPAAMEGQELRQMVTTASWVFDAASQGLKLSKKLIPPPSLSKESFPCQIWCNFKFQEIGSGEAYRAMESMTEKTALDVCAPAIGPHHPFLSSEKAKQVNKWVEGAEGDTCEQGPDVPLFNPSECPPPAKPTPAGIKSRKAIPIRKQQKQGDIPVQIPASESRYGHRARRIWRMEYNAGGPVHTDASPPRSGDADSAIDDLLGLDFNVCQDHNQSNSSDLIGPLKTPSSGSLSEQSARLSILKAAYERREYEPSMKSHMTASGSSSDPRCFVNRILAQQKIAEFERSRKRDTKQVNDETTSRDVHHTMGHSATRYGKSTKAKAKAKRQAVLEDAWGLPKRPVREQPASPPDAIAKIEEVDSPERGENGQRAGGTPIDAEMEKLFESLRSLLESAECFPGPLSLEVQIGLLLIPVPPKTYDGGSITLEEWTNIFCPNRGIMAPSTRFVSRVTTSGSNINHIVGLKTSSENGRHSLFEQEPGEYNVNYEFHCLVKHDTPLIINVGGEGRYSIKRAPYLLGGANLHFPEHIWAARVSLFGSFNTVTGVTPEIQEAARYLAESLWVKPEELVDILIRLPPNNSLKVEKVFMKRWTRHRHLHADEPLPETRAGTVTRHTGSSKTCRDLGHIFLQITEVQDLVLEINPQDPQALRARCLQLPEMTKRDRMWYEVSLVSPAIETILKSNSTLEVGERTNDWCAADLLGVHGAILHDRSSNPNAPLTSVGTAIGNAGLGDLYLLAKTVVEKIDTVGDWNTGPVMEPISTGNVLNPSANPPHLGSVPNRSKGLDFEELESIKEVGSAIKGDGNQVSSIAEAELRYW